MKEFLGALGIVISGLIMTAAFISLIYHVLDFVQEEPESEQTLLVCSDGKLRELIQDGSEGIYETVYDDGYRTCFSFKDKGKEYKCIEEDLYELVYDGPEAYDYGFVYALAQDGHRYRTCILKDGAVIGPILRKEE